MTPLQIARKTKDESVRQVGSALDMDPSTVSRVERGVQTPDANTADKLAKYFGLTLEQVMFPERFEEEAQAG